LPFRSTSPENVSGEIGISQGRHTSREEPQGGMFYLSSSSQV